LHGKPEVSMLSIRPPYPHLTGHLAGPPPPALDNVRMKVPEVAVRAGCHPTPRSTS